MNRAALSAFFAKIMKIASPLANKEELLPLVEAGADEFYCGFIPEEFKQQYGCFLNRRAWLKPNFSNYADLAKTIRLAHQHKTKVYITFNSYYTEDQYPLITKIIQKLCRINSDGFIVADIGLLFLLKSMRLKQEIQISTMGTVLNSQAARFFKNLGADHIVLPRHLTIKEIQDIAKNCRDLAYSVFILYDCCFFLEGFCSFHGVNGKSDDFKLLNNPLTEGPKCFMYDGHISEKLQPGNNVVCGVCAIADFKKIGIAKLKIVGREHPLEMKINGIKLIKGALNKLEHNNLSKPLFLKYIQKEKKRLLGTNDCNGLTCYYPSVFE